MTRRDSWASQPCWSTGSASCNEWQVSSLRFCRAVKAVIRFPLGKCVLCFLCVLRKKEKRSFCLFVCLCVFLNFHEWNYLWAVAFLSSGGQGLNCQAVCSHIRPMAVIQAPRKQVTNPANLRTMAVGDTGLSSQHLTDLTALQLVQNLPFAKTLCLHQLTIFESP